MSLLMTYFPEPRPSRYWTPACAGVERVGAGVERDGEEVDGGVQTIQPPASETVP